MSNQASGERFVRRLVLSVLLSTTLLMSASAIGIIVPRRPDVVAPRLESLDVSAKITNHIAQTRITHIFRNSNSRPVEADFFFPVPSGADITDFVLYMDGKPVKGEVLDKDQASQIYRDIVRRMKDPGLIEWHDKNLFRVRIFPIPANGEQKMEIEISQPLTADQGYFRYFLPLSEGNKVHGGATRAEIKIHIKADSPIRNLYSPTHQVHIDSKAPDEKKITSTTSLADAKDLIVYYEASDADITASLLTYRPAEQEGYFTLRISPPWNDMQTTKPAAPGAYIFVVDTSGSMAEGHKIGQAQKALRYCISLLKDQDKFNLVRFSSTVELFQPELAAATDSEKASAVSWIENLEARGGTNISEALRRALGLRDDNELSSGSASSISTIIFITDGLPTVGETSTEAILKSVDTENESNVRVFTFGVGHDVNTRLLDTIAEQTRAASDYVAPDADLEVPISRFFDQINRPALANVQLEIPGAEVSEMYPPRLPDLFYGTELAVFGKYAAATTAPVILKGVIAGEQKEYRFEKDFPGISPANTFVEKLWATRKVAWLLDQVRKSGESDELRKEIEELATRYSIVTPYTSYLAMEDEVSGTGTTRRQTASTRPASASRSWSFGEATASADKSLAAASPDAERSLRMESGAMAVRTAENLQRMKAAEVVQPERKSSKQSITVAGTEFILTDAGIWKDQAISGSEQETLKIKYMSEAWFQILEWFPEFSEIISLGEQVSFRLSENLILEVGNQGIDNIDVKTKEKIFLAAPKRN